MQGCRKLSDRSAEEDDSPEHLFLNNVAELHLWRTPQDCLDGCMALSTSVDFLLHNIAVAREKSLGTMYKVKATNSGGEGSVRSSRNGECWSTLMGSSSGVGGNGENTAVVVMKSKRSQRKAAEKAGGGTLLDLARYSMDTSGGLSPVRESPQGGSEGSPEAVRNSANSDLLRLSSSSVPNGVHVTGSVQGAESVGRWPLNTPCFSSVQGSKGRGQFHSIGKSEGSACARSSQFREAASPPPSHGDATLTREEQEGDGLPTGSLHRSSRMHSLRQQDRRSLSSPAPAVPEIPHFAQLMEEKEKRLKELEVLDRTSGKPPAPAMRCKAAVAAASTDSDNGSHPPSPCSSPSPPSVAPLTAKGPSCPEDAAAATLGIQDERVPKIAFPSPDMDTDTDSSSSEMEADHASECNFGENGHYVCVPGDTLNNRYTLICQLGIGRSSRVWLAVDLDQCSLSRSQLIANLGEADYRRFFNSKDRPSFVAIKIFRCGPMYTECAMYESRMMKYIEDSVKRAGGYGRGNGCRRQAFFEASHNSVGGGGESPFFLPTSEGGFDPLSSRGRLESPQRTFRQFLVGDSRTPLWSSDINGASLGFSRGNRGNLLGSSMNAPLPGMWASGYTNHLALMRNHFTVKGEYGEHHCIVMDVVGAGVDEAINETRLRGLPMDVVRSIMVTSLQGLAVLDALHIIHTDIKPENLLFIDLEKSTAREIETFLHSRIDTTGSRQLWNDSVKKRTSVAEYALLIASARSHVSHSSSTQVSPHHPLRDSVSLERVRDSSHDNSSCGVLSIGSDNGEAHAAGDSSRRVSADDARTLYEVRVSDYGLSFIVPPALREGVEVMKELSKECIEAQRTRHEEERRGVKGNDRYADRKGIVARALLKRAERRPKGYAAKVKGEEESEPPASVNEDDEEGDCVMTLDPKNQFKAMQRHHKKCLAEAQKCAKEEEAELQRRRRCPGPSSKETPGCEDDDMERLLTVLAAKLGSDSTQPHTGKDRYGGLSEDVEWKQDPLSPARDNGDRGALGSSWNDSLGGFGNASQGARSNQLRGNLTPFAIQAQRPPSDIELSILKDQVYGRGITIQSREYRAPEVILGFYFLPSCDIWSIGCVAYELVTGHFLFDIAEEYAAAKQRRARQQKEQRRGLSRRRVYSEDDSDEEEDGGRYSSHRYDSAGSSEEDEDLLHDFDREGSVPLAAPLYFNDDSEKDIDVVHLKCVMRLLGPPPLALLNSTPSGLFVDFFFGADGTFLFSERYENEADELGFVEIAPFREAELRAAGVGDYYDIPPVTGGGLDGSTRLGGSLQGHFASMTALSNGTSNAIVYRYSDDDDDEFEELARTVGGGAVVQHVHTRDTSAAPGAGVPGSSSNSKDSKENSEINSPHSARSHSVLVDDTTPSIGFGSRTSPSIHVSGTNNRHADVGGRDPDDTSNYPIMTEGWRRLRETIRDHIDSEDEAKSFEEFLLLCLQWDSSKRAKASDLLESRWLTHYGPLATTASLNANVFEETLAVRRRRKSP